MKPIIFEANERDFVSNGLGRLDPISCTVTEERNGQYELEMVVSIDDPHYGEITEGRLLLARHDDTSDRQPFEIYQITRELNGEATVFAHHVSYRTAKITVMPFEANSAAAAMAAMAENAVGGSPFSLWTDLDINVDFSSSEPASMRTLLGAENGSALAVYGGEFEWDKYTIKLHEHRGRESGVVLRYGRDITALSKTTDASSVWTGVVPFWKGTDQNGGTRTVTLPEKVIESEYADLFPYRMNVPLDLSSAFEEEPTQAALRETAQDYVRNNAEAVIPSSIEVSFVNLPQTDEYRDMTEMQRLRLCDTLSVVYKKLGVENKAAIVQTVFDVLTEKYISMAVGYVRQGIDGTISAPVLTKVEGDISHGMASVLAETGGQIDSAVEKIRIGAGNLFTRTNRGAEGWLWTDGTNRVAGTEHSYAGFRGVQLVSNGSLGYGSYIEFSHLNGEALKESTEYSISLDVYASAQTTITARLTDLSDSFVLGTVPANKLTRLTARFTTLSGIDSITRTGKTLRLSGLSSSNEVTYRFYNLLLQEGNKGTAWQEGNEELIAGTAVTITPEEFGIGTPAFDVDIPGDDAIHLDEGGGVFQNLTVTGRLLAGNVRKVYTGNTAVSIGAGGSYPTLTEFLEAVENRHIPDDLTVTLLNDVSIDTLPLVNLTGGGITIIGQDHTLTGLVTIENCSNHFSINGLTIHGRLYVSNSTVSLSAVTVNPRTVDSGCESAVELLHGARVTMNGCEIHNAPSLVQAGEGVDLVMVNCSGGGEGENTNFLWAAGANVKASGTRPYGDLHEELPNLIALPADTEAITDLTVDTGTAVSPASAITAAVITLAETYTDPYGSVEELAQGYTTQELHPVMKFSVPNAAKMKTLKHAILMLVRQAGIGISGDVNVHLYTALLSSTHGAPKNAAVTDHGVIGTIGNGEKKSFCVTAAAQELVNGTANALYLDTGDTAPSPGKSYSQHYAVFFTPLLQVSY